MNAKLFFEKCLEQATHVIDLVQTSDFKKPTPDTEWTVRDLVAHTLYELNWTADILLGKTIAEVGDAYEGDLIQGDLQGNWHAAADRARLALQKVDTTSTVHVSFADVSAEEYLRQAGCDQLIHAWDLGQAIGRPVHFEPDVAAEAHAYYDKNIRDWGGMLFKAPISVPDDAEMQIKLLAITGRQPR